MKHCRAIMILCACGALSASTSISCAPAEQETQIVRAQTLAESVPAKTTGARVQTARFDGQGSYRLGKPQEMRQGIFQQVPGSFEISTSLPARHPRLDFILGFFCSGETEPALVDARISVKANGAENVVFERTLWVRPVDIDFSFSEERIDLSPWAGNEITLVFSGSVRKGDGTGAEIVWGDAVIRATAEADLPPVVLICVDALRRDRVGIYHEGASLTPRLDAFAADAVVFDDVTAHASWTLPSVVSVLTGLTPSLHNAGRRLTLASNPTEAEVAELRRQFGVVNKRGTDYVGMSRLDGAVITLPELLRRHGYATRAFSGNAFISFDADVISRFGPVTDMTIHGIVLSREANRWLAGHADERFFLYLHYMEPHEWRGHFYERGGIDAAPDAALARAVYDDLVLMADRHVGDVLDQLKRLDLYDRALIVFYADHGELLYETEGNYAGHGVRLNEALIAVPLIVKFPGNEFAGKRVSDPVALLDIFHTIAETADLLPDDPLYRLGVSLRKTAMGEGLRNREIVSEFMLFEDERIAITHNGYRYERNLDRGEDRLFRARGDELLDLAQPENAALMKRLRERLDAYREASAKAAARVRTMKVDETEAEKLRHLGYLQ